MIDDRNPRWGRPAPPNPWMQTHTGGMIDLIDPDPKSITLFDVATHLATIPRFAGAVGVHRHYSVAEHSLLVEQLMYGSRNGCPARERLHALLHDAHEMVTGDIPTPVKAVLGLEIRDLEDRIQRAITMRLLGEPPLPETTHVAHAIKNADALALRFEREHMMVTPPASWGDENVTLLKIDGWPKFLSPAMARIYFVQRFAELSRKCMGLG